MAIDLHGDQEISLQDAIALDFFLDHIKIMFEGKPSDDLDIAKNVTLLATSAYHIAEIFCNVRDQIKQQKVNSDEHA